jgi:hypothetical protein
MVNSELRSSLSIGYGPFPAAAMNVPGSSLFHVLPRLFHHALHHLELIYGILGEIFGIQRVIDVADEGF